MITVDEIARQACLLSDYMQRINKNDMSLLEACAISTALKLGILKKMQDDKRRPIGRMSEIFDRATFNEEQFMSWLIQLGKQVKDYEQGRNGAVKP